MPEKQTSNSKRGRRRQYDANESYQRNKDRNRDFKADERRVGQDIGPIPEVLDWSRREACLKDPEKFLRTYFGFGDYFYNPFSDDHRITIAKAEEAIRFGGLFAIAHPRGFGKTTMARGFAIRAIAAGWRNFVFVVGAANHHARSSIDAIQEMMQISETFTADFPEIAYPLRKLERQPRSQGGQRSMGTPTGIHYAGEYIQIATVMEFACPACAWAFNAKADRNKTPEHVANESEGGLCPGSGTSPNKLQPHMRPEQFLCGGAIVHATGIGGSNVRGPNVRGRRPDYLLVDDPQTEDTARMPSACDKRESIITGMVTGLAAPNVKLAGVMACTVIQPNDLSDKFLDHTKHPEWDSVRTQLLKAFPSDMQKWEEYASVRNNFSPYAGVSDKKRAASEATDFYMANDKAMQTGEIEGKSPAGEIVKTKYVGEEFVKRACAWQYRIKPDEVDALQNAMNAYFDNKRKFWAELMNAPLPMDTGNVKALTADEICKKTSGYPKGIVPLEATTLTAFIDVQQSVLYWLVAAWRDGFTGWVVDYGTWPDQARPYFTKATLPNTFDRQRGGLFGASGIAGYEGQIVAALKTLTKRIVEHEWPRHAGGTMRVNQMLIDSGSKFAKLVYEFVRTNPYGGELVLPSKGMYVGATSANDVDEGAIKPGDRRGLKWRLPAAKEDRGCKLLLTNVNFWKSFVHERLAVAAGNNGCLSLFGNDPDAHRMIADHLTAEYPTEVKSKQRECIEWREKPGKPDNDWLDCLVGAAVAASLNGVSAEGYKATKKPVASAPVSFRAMQDAARAKR